MAKTKRDASTADCNLERRENDRRAKKDRRVEQVAVAVERRSIERREKVNRRRQIDPTTCERDYSDEEVEFMRALDQYKRTSGRMFPTCSEMLEVIRGLGYERRQTESPATSPDQLEAGRQTSDDIDTAVLDEEF